MGKKYDIAISFAGEDRDVANEIATKLKHEGVTVFYDNFEKANLWGKNLYEHLITIYKDSSKYCLMLISENYAKKMWTSHERRAAQARAFKESREYILPLKLDNAKIEGILETTSYLDYRNETSDSVTKHILKKLWGDYDNDEGFQKIKKSLEELYMRMMLTCELAFMPSDHQDFQNRVLAPELYESSILLFNQFKSDVQIFSKVMDIFILGQITDVVKGVRNILQKVHFLLLLNNPKFKRHYFISEFPEFDFEIVYKFMERSEVFNNYKNENKRLFIPEEILNSWSRAELETSNFSSDLKNFKPKQGFVSFVFNEITLKNMAVKHLKHGDMVELFERI